MISLLSSFYCLHDGLPRLTYTFTDGMTVREIKLGVLSENLLVYRMASHIIDTVQCERHNQIPVNNDDNKYQIA